jgi:hypothetical protein
MALPLDADGQSAGVSPASPPVERGGEGEGQRKGRGVEWPACARAPARPDLAAAVVVRRVEVE